MKPLNVLISGASVAGPALAYWLTQHGHRATVVERAPAPRPGGQAVDLRGPARQLVERMGLLEEIRRAHTGARGMAFVDAQGRRVADMGADLLGDSGGVIADLEILRGDLVAILTRAVEGRVTWRFSDSIAALTQVAGGVEVAFERGDRATYDVVVGADGLHSNVRRLAFGDASRWLSDLGCYVSVFTTRSALAFDGWSLMHSVAASGSVGGKTIGLYPTRISGEARAMLYLASPRLELERHDVAGQQRLLQRAFAEVGWEAPRILASMAEAPDFYFDRVTQVRMPRWSSGRVALLGDAAHCASPLAGNGTSMALVGAYLLAGELASTPAEPASAFERYEAQMRSYVEGCQRFALDGVGSLMPASRTQLWFRNFGIRMLPYLPFRSLLFGGYEKLVNAVQLPAYP